MLVDLTIETLSVTYSSPRNLSTGGSETHSENNSASPFVQDSSDVVGGEEPLEFGDE